MTHRTSLLEFLAVLLGNNIGRLTTLHGRDVGQPPLELAWLSLLGRRPTAAELQGALAAGAEGGGRRRALEDVIWSIFNSAELGAVW